MGTTSPLPAGDRTYSADSRVLAPPLKREGIRREREVVPTARRAIRVRSPASTRARARRLATHTPRPPPKYCNAMPPKGGSPANVLDPHHIW